MEGWNSTAATNTAERVVKKSDLKELDEPLMLAEDFSFYQKEVKGLFIFVGTKTNEFQSGLHTGTFNFNESVLQSVVDMYMKIILNYQEEK